MNVSLKEWLCRLKKKTIKHNPLSARSVRFSYEDEEVLKDVTLNIKGGTITSIIGRSGGGKSTFLKLAAGTIAKRYKGKILIFGRSNQLKKHTIGFVPQENSFIPDLSLGDNISIHGLNFGIGEKQALKNAKRLMRSLRLDEDLCKKPDMLSGGQKVRLNIILSLLHEPDILVLDEPFVGLDFLNRKLLWHFLESMKKKGKSIIITSHLLSETQEHADRLVILKEGKVFFNGKLESLKNKLKFKFVLETRFSFLSQDNLKNIIKYCNSRDIKILDMYGKYLMFSLKAEQTKDALLRLFDSVKMKYEIISFREPNLDEIFLKA